MKRYYFDYAATTPLLPEVKAEAMRIMDEVYGNPSSIHAHGRIAKNEIEEARKKVAQFLNCSLGEIFFTSGATESNNIALYKSVEDLGVTRIISSPTEHHCVLHTLEYLEKHKSVELVYLDVDTSGNLDYMQLEQLLSDTTTKTLVSLMHVNNELGTTHDIARIAELCKNHNSYFNCDAAQSFGKKRLDLAAINIDFLAISSHKIYGPKGVGVLYLSNDVNISPLFLGGAQERNMRAGTENIIGISSFAKAVEIADRELEERYEIIEQFRTYLLQKLETNLPQIIINGSTKKDQYINNIISLDLPNNPKTELLVFNLDIAGISASAGSACSSGVEQKSHVIAAIKPDSKNMTLRISLSHITEKEELDYLVKKLEEIC
jgi:cysteine desulfurase